MRFLPWSDISCHIESEIFCYRRQCLITVRVKRSLHMLIKWLPERQNHNLICRCDPCRAGCHGHRMVAMAWLSLGVDMSGPIALIRFTPLDDFPDDFISQTSIHPWKTNFSSISHAKHETCVLSWIGLIWLPSKDGRSSWPFARLVTRGPSSARAPNSRTDTGIHELDNSDHARSVSSERGSGGDWKKWTLRSKLNCPCTGDCLVYSNILLACPINFWFAWFKWHPPEKSPCTTPPSEWAYRLCHTRCILEGAIWRSKSTMSATSRLRVSHRAPSTRFCSARLAAAASVLPLRTSSALLFPPS